MDEHLNRITEVVSRYESGEYLTADSLRDLLRELTSEMYFLTKYKIQFKNKHNEIRYRHKGSVASGEILAHEQCPELYQIRYILRAAEAVKTSIVMEISILNKES